MLDLNQRIQVSKTCALPLGESPSRRASPPELVCSLPRITNQPCRLVEIVAHGDLPHNGTRTRVFPSPTGLVLPLNYVRRKTHVQELNLCTALSSACAYAAQLLALQPRAAIAPTCDVRLASDCHTLKAVFHAHCHSLWGTATPTSVGSCPTTGRGVEIPTRVLRVPSAAGLSIFPTPRYTASLRSLHALCYLLHRELCQRSAQPTPIRLSGNPVLDELSQLSLRLAQRTQRGKALRHGTFQHTRPKPVVFRFNIIPRAHGFSRETARKVCGFRSLSINQSGFIVSP